MIVSIVGGAGGVGTVLAERLAGAGHSITLAVRDPNAEKVSAAVAKVAKAARLPDRVASSTIRPACDGADVVLIATPGMPTAKLWAPVVESMGPCKGKPIIDCTNPLTPWPELDISTDRNSTSATEEIASLMPEAAGVWKAFNTVGIPVLAEPAFEGKSATMLYAGPGKAESEEAFNLVTKVIGEVGFDPLYVGPSIKARNLESLAEIWIHMALRYNDLPYQKEKASDSKGFAWSVLFR